MKQRFEKHGCWELPSSKVFVWMLISSRSSVMQALCCLYANQIKHLDGNVGGRRKGSSTCSCNFTVQVECDYAPTPQSGSSAPLTSHQGQLERKWLYRPSFRNQWGLFWPSPAPTAAVELSKWEHEHGRGAEKSLWRSVYLCRMGSQIVVCITTWKAETEGFQCCPALSCSRKSLCSGEQLRVV